MGQQAFQVREQLFFQMPILWFSVRTFTAIKHPVSIIVYTPCLLWNL